MRGSIWTIAAAGITLGLLPALLDVSPSDDTGQAAIDLTSAIGPIIGLMFFVGVLAVVVSVITSDGF
ncbi:hypothetical protein KM295_14195 [Natronomonas sp. F2-12]|uniref:Uncharacterized protein n=1 Tax=Natronomonas aquatica TaxID=2841590 RepID=A0A9R1CW88_9EURY|nr:hypothetical protein [Natronomonas aquatica]MCQ4334606.1 hypothetical protein [Natronomonas aquatica]